MSKPKVHFLCVLRVQNVQKTKTFSPKIDSDVKNTFSGKGSVGKLYSCGNKVIVGVVEVVVVAAGL